MMGRLQTSYFLLLNLLITSCQVVKQKPCNHLHQLNINYVHHDNMSIPCFTTIRSLESLTVKLRKNNPVTDILIYPDISPASEHQRWSVRKDAGNVTLNLKDIRLSDEGLYDCQVYSGLNCINATRFNLRVKECKTLDSVYATSGSSVLLPCSEHPQQNTTDQVIWKVVTGHQSTEISKYSHPQNSPIKVFKPFYMRAKKLANGSLLIRDAINADEMWYQCATEKICYEVKLLIKEKTFHPTTTLKTFSTTPLDPPTSAVSPVGLIKGNTATLMSVIAKVTLIVMATSACVILYFKMRRSKITNQRFDVQYYTKS